MRTLTKRLLITSNALLILLTSSCDTEIVDYDFFDRCLLVNSTDKDISFSSDSSDTYEICSGDTIYYDNTGICPIFIVEIGGHPKLHIGNDSTISLFESNYACWPYNCQSTQLGEHEWLRTYVIDDQWIKDAWTEAQNEECEKRPEHWLH